MCGIVGAIAKRDVVPILLEGLRRLEYRGYDSAGLAVVNGGLHRLRSVGRVASLTDLVNQAGITGGLGIAHTRWATHGAPSPSPREPGRAGGRA
jgi:glucosamine--fructose-6-phosphate aminotransferase (isomerizing)